MGFTTNIWEVNISPQFGEGPQELINTTLLYNSDLAIVLFWDRFGASTGNAPSGAYEELVAAIKKGIRTAIFVSQKAVIPKYIDLEGQSQIQDLRRKIHRQEFVSEGVYQDYFNEFYFKDYFLRFLTKYAEDLINGNIDGALPSSNVTVSNKNTNTAQELLSPNLEIKSSSSV